MPAFSFWEEQRKNVTKSYILIFVFVIMMGLFGFLIDFSFEVWPWFTIVFLGLALIQVLIGVASGPSLILSSVGARPLDQRYLEHKQLQNILNEMGIASGLRPLPKLYYIPGEKSINAFATGLKTENAHICVTEGLLEALDREETQGVVAHEMSHIMNKDMLYMTLLSAILGAVVIIQVLAFRGAWMVAQTGGGRSRKDSSGCGYAVLFLLIVGVLATIFAFLGRILLFAVSRQREYLADAKAAEFTRNPRGLASALRKIALTPGKVKNATIATAHLFISDPLRRMVNEKEGFFANLFSTHPPVYQRIARLEGKSPEQVLRELKGELPPG
ncbi:MAG: M48 family metalloprotease [Caldiserica bacterium]|jgi:heat shock protein HtpX|nr:M48 family metalloprotease [Caldisericota bacterium]MDH7561995.1 M48 family metalloprotease [Caldisericota bacterium]